MLPRQYRLRLTNDIQSVYKGGKRWFHPLFRFVVLPTTRSIWRAAVVVSTKVSTKAVDRNTIKRRIRAILWQKHLEIKPGHDIVIIAQREAIGATTEQLATAFDRLSKQAQLYDF